VVAETAIVYEEGHMKGRVPRILSVAAAMALALNTAAAPIHPAPVRADTGVSITGAVTGSAGGLAAIHVFACQPDGWGCVSGTVDGSGHFSVGGLTPYTYILRFDDPSQTYVASGYYNGAGLTPYLNAAAWLVVTNVDVALPSFDLPLAVTITGAVTGSAGNLGGIQVGPCFANSPSCFPGAQTDAGGHFTLGGLFPGDYWVMFHDATYTYVDGFYTDTGRLVEGFGSTVIADAGVVTLNTVQLETASTISGTLVGERQGLASVGACPRPTHCISANTDASGHFVIRGLAAGTYVLEAFYSSYPYTRYYSDSGAPVVDPSQATPVTVPPSASGLIFFLNAATAPAAPTGVTATPGNSNAVVSWVAPADGGSPILSYTATASDGIHSCVETTTGCIVSGLVNGTAYTFTVTATNALGAGPASDLSNSVTPVGPPVRQAQSISFGPLADTVYGAAPIPLTASATSGLPVDLSAYNACTLSGNTLILTSSGWCTVVASQWGNAYWLGADQVPRVFFVAPAPLSISAPSAARAYGAANPALTPTISGFVNGDTAANLTAQPTCTTAATATSPVGTYPTTCSGAVSANYTPTYVPGTLTITPVPLTVSAPNAARAYGAANPAFTPSYSGFVNGDTAASLTTQPTCTSAATPATAVGAYPIDCSGAASANYAIAYVSGTLSIVIANRFVAPAGTTLNVAAPGFLALTNASGATIVISTPPSGKLTIGTGGAFTYTPKRGFVGVDSFAYRLKVGGHLSAPVTVTIYVVGTGMNCKWCNLSGLALSWAALGGANLSGANLTGSWLDHANLKGANLSGANLSNANLVEARLKGANLSRAVLTNVDLTGADLSGANLTGVTWSNTTCPDGTNSTNNRGTCKGHLTP
jgi:hypothetical protein